MDADEPRFCEGIRIVAGAIDRLDEAGQARFPPELKLSDLEKARTNPATIHSSKIAMVSKPMLTRAACAGKSQPSRAK